MNDYVSGVAPKRAEPVQNAPHPDAAAARSAPDSVAHGTASVTGAGRDGNQPKPQAAVREKVSLDELAEMLRKVNLTFDLFEIAAEYTVQHEPNRILVVIRNTRTGEVIRRIPPEEFVANYSDIRNGLGTVINASV